MEVAHNDDDHPGEMDYSKLMRKYKKCLKVHMVGIFEFFALE